MRTAALALLIVLGAAPVTADTSAAPPASIRWQAEPAGLAAARKLRRPVLLYFGAEWCMPCKEMERGTFGDRRVARELERFVAIRVDCTDPDSTPAGAIMKRWKVEALPAVILLDGAGREHRRIGQFMEADALLPILTAIR